MSDSTTYCLLFSSESPWRSTKRDDSVQHSGQDRPLDWELGGFRNLCEVCGCFLRAGAHVFDCFL